MIVREARREEDALPNFVMVDGDREDDGVVDAVVSTKPTSDRRFEVEGN